MFNTILVDGVNWYLALICLAVSLVLGLIISFVYSADGNSSKSMRITLILLPALVQVIIMLVNGQIGTGIAVLGAFSIIRFRSATGGAKEIASVLFAMAIGLATGMGYVAFAGLFTIIISLVMFVLYKSKLGEKESPRKRLRIQIPEELDYTSVFNDLFAEYTTRAVLDRVKTTNLGTMYELSYDVTLKNINDEKKFLDAIRCRNGNLTVCCAHSVTVKEEL